MANSKYEYVKAFEAPDKLLPNAWIVVRVDGRGFHRFTERHKFQKPNDVRGLGLMNAAAKAVFHELHTDSLVAAYGVSDEYSFVFNPKCELFERRSSKIVTTVVSTFTAHYIYLWPEFFPDTKLSLPLPSFDGRAVLYPTTQNLRDYMSWRQVDCHINNLYNTTFWSLVLKGGMNETEAENELKGTVSGDKHEILFSRFKINYNNEDEMFKKGSVVYRQLGNGSTDEDATTKEPPREEISGEKSKSQLKRDAKKFARSEVVVEHVDIIKDVFWEKRPWILSSTLGRPGKYSGER